jgi:hypothetical protein
MPNFVIDNAGGGDCGFYALSIALIDIIQKEYKSGGKSAAFNSWKQAGLANVELAEILQVDLHAMQKATGTDDQRTIQRPLLDKLQFSLRDVARNYYRDDLLAQIRKETAKGGAYIDGSPIFTKFVWLVNEILSRVPNDSRFNELALSKSVVELARRTAETIKAELETKFNLTYNECMNLPNGDARFKQADTIVTNIAKSALLKDVMHKGKVNDQSLILAGIDVIQQQGRWAIDEDLANIARTLSVPIVFAGQAVGIPERDVGVATLENRGNAHWVTVVDLPPAPTPAPIVPAQQAIPVPVPVAPVTAKSVPPVAPVTAKSVPSVAPVAANPIPLVSDEKILKVIETTVSSQASVDKAKLYRDVLKDLIITALNKQGFFNTGIKNKIQESKIDSATAEAGESDEDFARRLQEAEFRKVGLIK